MTIERDRRLALQPSGMLSLPDELLATIFSYDQDWKIGQVCRRFQSVCDEHKKDFFQHPQVMSIARQESDLFSVEEVKRLFRKVYEEIRTLDTCYVPPSKTICVECLREMNEKLELRYQVEALCTVFFRNTGMALNDLPPQARRFGELLPSPTDSFNESQIASEIRLWIKQDASGLTLIKILPLQNKGLKRLPSEIDTFPYLEGLDLSYNQLIKLPPEIGNLPYLHQLSLHKNQLTELPAEIGNLSSLRVLWLSNNQLTALPPEIGNLSSLYELHLHKNQLTSLPPEIRNLRNLERLKVDKVLKRAIDSLSLPKTTSIELIPSSASS